MNTSSSDLLKSFISYCEAHPNERFWQALRNWCGWGFVFVGNMGADGYVRPVDTFYWEENYPKATDH